MKQDDYKNVSSNPEEWQFGRTVIKLTTSDYTLLDGYSETTTHGCIYIGKSMYGTKYVFTKNGWTNEPSIDTLKAVNEEYDSWQKIGDAYFNFK